jgi:lysozyme family protein
MRGLDDALKVIYELEGGYSDREADPGGKTKYGVTEQTLQEAKDLGLLPAALQVRDLTKEEARLVYKILYWEKCSCSVLPYPIALVLFDTAVNHGASTAKRWLQGVLGVRVDGVIGEITLEAAKTAHQVEVIKGLCKRRARNYLHEQRVLVEETFELGWVNRLIEIEAEGIVAALSGEKDL